MRERPIVAVMVSDASPAALAQIRRSSQWADVIVLEGLATLDGTPREPLRDGWRDVTGLGRDQLRVVTTQLGEGTRRRRERIQRDSLIGALRRESADRLVVLADDDEFIDPMALELVVAESPLPFRVRMETRYGAIDRVAPAGYCCLHRSPESARRYSPRAFEPATVAGPLVARTDQLLGSSPGQMRRKVAKSTSRTRAALHVTFTQSSEAVAEKMALGAHRWSPRTMWPRHLDTVLAAGVHHAGWWIASAADVPDWLGELAATSALRRAGPTANPNTLRAIRAWAQDRLEPTTTDAEVRRLDELVTNADAGTLAHFLARDEEQQKDRERPSGYAPG